MNPITTLKAVRHTQDATSTNPPFEARTWEGIEPIRVSLRWTGWDLSGFDGEDDVRSLEQAPVDGSAFGEPSS
jgi:hypothetical protein